MNCEGRWRECNFPASSQGCEGSNLAQDNGYTDSNVRDFSLPTYKPNSRYLKGVNDCVRTKNFSIHYMLIISETYTLQYRVVEQTVNKSMLSMAKFFLKSRQNFTRSRHYSPFTDHDDS